MSWYFPLIIGIIAFLYATIGHGGSSGYLALFSLFSWETSLMKGSALLLNIFVSSVAFSQYFRKGYFKLKLFLPFAIPSIPLAFLGGSIDLDPVIYKRVLAILLLLATLKILGVLNKSEDEEIIKPISLNLAVLIGALIGFFSGLIGIGGGIFLSPIILVFNWGNVKETAAVSALFILITSLSAFLGHNLQKIAIYPETFLLIPFVVIGGFLGSYLGANKFNSIALKYLLALVLLLASIKLLIT